MPEKIDAFPKIKSKLAASPDKTGPDANDTHEKLSDMQVLGWTVEYNNALEAKIVVNREEQRLTVNRKYGVSPDHLRQIGILAVAREAALLESLRGVTPGEAIRVFSEDKCFTAELLRLTGARLLKEWESKIAQEISDTLPFSDSAAGEFKTACALYLATGSFPRVSETVAAELESLPVSPKTGEHILLAFTSERVALFRKKDYFIRFLSPALERLRKLDADLYASESESFQPSTDDSLENRELDESEIMQRVLPFASGYFREKVMDGIDWEAMRAVATGVVSEKLLPPEEARAIPSEAKIHTFRGINGKELAGGSITAPLPASAAVFPETATRGLVIRRSANGTHTLIWSREGEPSAEYEFLFERKEEPQDWQKTKPTKTEKEIPSWVIETFSIDTKKKIEELRQARLTDGAKVRQIAFQTQKIIEYTNNTSVGEALSKAGRQYFAKLEEIKKGDCDVSNFYALAQIRAMNIPCRMITGFHVKKDKRFPFAALAGAKHAWLEWWNKESGLWERIDATPPKPPEENKKEQDGEGGEDQKKELNFSEKDEAAFTPEESDDDPFGLPFEEEDLIKLKERLSELPDPNASDSNVAQIFKDLYGISKERWENIRVLAEAVGRQKLPREATINKQTDSTVAKEWKRIYDLLLIAYRLPSRSRRTMERQSQGGELIDPVSAGIDVMIGSEDPYGFENKERRERTERLPIRFSNDFLLDITASMLAKNREGKSLLELEREFLLSSLYEGYKLNERVKQRVAELFAAPLITSCILSIHGGAKWQEIIKNSPMELKELAAIDEAFKKPTPGAGAMAEAIEQYAKSLEEDAAIVAALKNKEMIKTLTVITDGNLWCSVCGKESCSYEFHGPTLARVNKALKKVRELGVIVNAIGFTEQSRPVAELFSVKGDPEAAVVAENLGEALAAHHRQTVRVMSPVAQAAQRRQPSLINN